MTTDKIYPRDTVMPSNELCRLVCQEYRCDTLEGKNCDGLDCEVCQLNKQAEITGKIMYDEGFKAGKQEIGEAICILVGNTMLRDMESGKLLGEQLRPIIDLCKR